jgi:excinuclease ABC subunit B
VNAEVILFGDEVTDSMRRAMGETERRRDLQLAYNTEHGIEPRSIRKAIREILADEISRSDIPMLSVRENEVEYSDRERLKTLEEEMYAAADALDFELAASLRDRIVAIRGAADGPKPAALAAKAGKRKSKRSAGR